MLQSATLILTALLLQTPTPSLDSTNPKERIEAVEKLALTGRTENVAPLAEALRKEPKSDVRAAMVAGLGRIGVAEVIPVLTQSLQTDLDKDVRLQVVDSFQRLYIPVSSNTGPIETIFGKVKSVFALPDRPLVHNAASVNPAVNAALADSMQKDFSQEVRAAAARALGSLRARDRLAVMVATLESPQNREHLEVRLEIVESLGFLQDTAAGPALERALQDSSSRIRQAAILSIGLVGYKAARPALENILRTDRSIESKERALEAIALLRDPEAAPLLESLLGHPDDKYRELAAEGLGRIGHDPEILKARYDTEKKANVRNALAFALVSADQKGYFIELTNALDSRQAYQAEVYLFELGKYEGKLTELHNYLKSANPRVRARITRILGDIANPSSRPLIEELTKDKDSEVAGEAIVALRKLTPA
ncbi:MAG TPA: HEAT repeat domain-containing protein [Terriglobia bacterium]|nr:HEAT repeat domain-containing protein [Terriglobia bacterium]